MLRIGGIVTVMDLMSGRREGVWLRVERREEARVADDKWIELYSREVRYLFHSVLTRRSSVVSKFQVREFTGEYSS
jgi:hypothetical protein